MGSEDVSRSMEGVRTMHAWSIGLIRVRDGLRHLEQPFGALAEIARDARCALSITEPAQAAIIGLAVELGIALEREEVGNEVGRLSVDEVTGHLKAPGFESANAHPYGMFYRNELEPMPRWFSARAMLPLATDSLRGLNLAAGRYGNKLTIKALRVRGARG
jgi:hypothetical protein